MSSFDLVPIQTLDVEAQAKIPFDLYVHLPLNQKYLLYRRVGGEVDARKLENLALNNFSHFYIEKKHYREFVKYVARRIRSLIGVESTESSLRVMTGAARAVLSSTMNQQDPAIAKALMENLNEITSVIIESVLEESTYRGKKIYQKVLALSDKGTDFQKHPVNVTSLAVLITFGIGYTREQMISDVAMAALLHDIGLSRLPTRVIPHSHDLLKLGIYERDWVKKHPVHSVEILEERKIPISDLTKTIILQHHEEFNGTGFPMGTRGFNLNELSQILRVADEIDQLFGESWTSGGFRKQLEEKMDGWAQQKVIEPTLLARIKAILI